MVYGGVGVEHLRELVALVAQVRLDLELGLERKLLPVALLAPELLRHLLADDHRV